MIKEKVYCQFCKHWGSDRGWLIIGKKTIRFKATPEFPEAEAQEVVYCVPKKQNKNNNCKYFERGKWWHLNHVREWKDGD